MYAKRHYQARRSSISSPLIVRQAYTPRDQLILEIVDVWYLRTITVIYELQIIIMVLCGHIFSKSETQFTS